MTSFQFDLLHMAAGGTLGPGSVVAGCSYGNDSIALIQWCVENGLQDVTCLYNDTGWAREGWSARVDALEAWARSFGYRPVRTASVGMEALVRARKGWPRQGLQFCTEHLKGRGHFESFVGNISIGKAGKVTSEARHGIVSMLGREVDAVITHQWENGLNYLFWDTLYLGYPLIHNSPEIAEAGYWYESFNPQMGGEALIEAMAHHTGPSEADKQAVWRHHINNPANLDGYAKLIQKLLDGDQAGD